MCSARVWRAGMRLHTSCASHCWLALDHRHHCPPLLHRFEPPVYHSFVVLHVFLWQQPQVHFTVFPSYILGSLRAVLCVLRANSPIVTVVAALIDKRTPGGAKQHKEFQGNILNFSRQVDLIRQHLQQTSSQSHSKYSTELPCCWWCSQVHAQAQLGAMMSPLFLSQYKGFGVG